MLLPTPAARTLPPHSVRRLPTPHCPAAGGEHNYACDGQTKTSPSLIDCVLPYKTAPPACSCSALKQPCRSLVGNIDPHLDADHHVPVAEHHEPLVAHLAGSRITAPAGGSFQSRNTSSELRFHRPQATGHKPGQAR
jgi:hypothetical protein